MIIAERVGFVAFLMVLVACGNARHSVRLKKNGAACPSALALPFHQVTVHTTDTIPAKIAVEIEGKTKYDECLEQPVIAPAPIVRAVRGKRSVAVVVQHFGAYTTLPETFSFQIFDRGNCVSSPLRFFRAEKVELDFKTEYPYGKQCGSLTSAKVELKK